jgi:GAF domain-containing protein
LYDALSPVDGRIASVDVPLTLEGTSMETEFLHNAMERLITVIQKLSLARDVATVMALVRHAARALTGADGTSFVVREDDWCYYADEEAIGPLWKGQRFPMTTCISGWVMMHRQPAVIADIYADARIPVAAYAPTFVKSLVMVPIRTMAPIGAIGVYWAQRHRATPAEVQVLQALADSTSMGRIHEFGGQGQTEQCFKASIDPGEPQV